MSSSFSPTSRVYNPNSPASSFATLPKHLERKIAARWKEWEPWVCLQQLRAPHYEPAIAAAETDRLRKRHTEHILALMSAGIAMRLVRRHRLDDPRLTDETRAVLVQAVLERRRKVRLGRHSSQDHLHPESILWPGPRPTNAAAANLQHDDLCRASPFSQNRETPKDLQQTMHAIQTQVSDHFHLSELRDPELKVRNRRQIFAFPRQIAMYIARDVTAASLEEIGREFGGRHHTTVLHSINKIEKKRRADEKLNCTITRMVEALKQH
jgi:hypothetical protein